MSKIILVSGKNGAGKDTLADYLVQKYEFVKSIDNEFVDQKIGHRFRRRRVGIGFKRERLSKNFNGYELFQRGIGSSLSPTGSSQIIVKTIPLYPPACSTGRRPWRV